MYVYYVYDDEWSDINGEEQLKEFALMQSQEKYNTCGLEDEIIPEIHSRISEPFIDTVLEIFSRINNKDKNINILELITVDVAIQLLKLRDFKVDIIYVY